MRAFKQQYKPQVRSLQPKYEPRFKQAQKPSKLENQKPTEPTPAIGADSQIDPVLILKVCTTAGSSTIRMLFSLFIISCFVRTAMARCEPPLGSYRDTCKATGSAYFSSDRNLGPIPFCKFTLDCEAIDGKKSKKTTFYVQESMSGCLRFFENCDGTLVDRNSNNRVCTTKEVIERESLRAKEL